MPRRGTFRGGIDLAEEKHATLNSPIRPFLAFSRLLVPIALPGGSPAEPVVKIGDLVAAGQKIAGAQSARRGSRPAARRVEQESNGTGAPPSEAINDAAVAQPAVARSDGLDIFAPLAGRVAGFVTAAVAGRDGFLDVPVIELKELESSADSAEPRSGQPSDWRSARPEELLARIADGALTTYRLPLRSLSARLAEARAKNCRTLIANAMECQPYVTADHRLMVEHAREVVEGLAILAAALGAERVFLAVDHRHAGDYGSRHDPEGAPRIERVALTHKYPAGLDPMLAYILTGREMPPGGSPLDVGVGMVDAACCMAVFQWVAEGVRPLGRVVTVAGERAETPGNYWVPFGTPCGELAGAADPLVHGGPMTGLACAGDAVVTPATDAVLALEPIEVGHPGPCIRCGWCTEHCPARLNVSAVNDLFELGQIERARRLGVMASIECGVCSYVCPARLPLTQRVKSLKHAIRLLEGEKA